MPFRRIRHCLEIQLKNRAVDDKYGCFLLFTGLVGSMYVCSNPATCVEIEGGTGNPSLARTPRTNTNSSSNSTSTFPGGQVENVDGLIDVNIDFTVSIVIDKLRVKLS